MRFYSVVAPSALLALQTTAVVAQTTAPVPPEQLPLMPDCGIKCLHYAMSLSPCGADLACQCTDDALIETMTGCVMASCTIKETLLTRNISAMACGEPVRDKSPGYVAVSNSFGILSSLFVIQRFAYKLWAKLELGPDDWLTLAAMVSSTPSIVFNAHVVAPNGMGRDTWTLSYDNITVFCRYFFIMEIIYFADVALVKLALLYFYVRIFPSTGVRHLLLGTILFVALFGTTFIFVAIFQCKPIDYYWWKWDGEHQGQCMDFNAIAWSNAAISIVIDVWMLAIPMWQLKNLRLDWTKKLGVGMMFSVGTFVTVVSILRLRALNFSVHTANPTWDFFDVGIWSTVEINVGIICVCMPSLRLLLVRICPRLSQSAHRYYAHHEAPAGAYNRAASKQQPCQTGTTSRVERSHFRPPVNANGISYETSYEVEFGDKDKADDELQLVIMRDADVKSMASSRSERSVNL
ncbi:CFEM domain-containing protein [Hirsutella rhossiliensis]|uniref:CFEM domain-containing protein n=1 Tax=Hirsutella rhossiliensis TaxID=111463 RepID=A0A9P8MW36_9HYPO|nr:CFEM domain-containing protein [Hirsutella rhossiliensis]KAH0960237.1 CFEM domain-containing protein [Hirsutella rhossiliensis]